VNDRIRARLKAYFPGYELFLNLAAMGLLAFLLLLFGGCSPRVYNPYPYESETKYEVNSKTHFKSGPIHIVGEASCPYILFTIPLCTRQDLASVAFNRMYQQANIEGLSAHLVNVTHDAYLTANLFLIFFIDHHAVSADVIVYEKISAD